MGTTMHAHIEVRQNGRWLHYANPNVPQNYVLFDMIAGVRNEDPDIIPVASFHSLPGDMSDITRACWEYDRNMFRAHNTGILTSDDLTKLQHNLTAYAENHSWCVDMDLEHVIFRTYINHGSIAAHVGFDDSRIVFWFDN